MFAAIVFIIMLLSIIIVMSGTFILDKLGLIKSNSFERVPLFLFSLVSLITGTVISLFVSKKPLKPIRDIMTAADRIAAGDYSVRINLNGSEEFKQLSNSFNHMAEEIGSVEMLRNDFVNNFSHEFKTPIVSIRGFAKMLKRNDLTHQERNEYLNIIITESERLSELSTNVLNLSKVEQQSILTDKKRFNVSEQIRLVIAALYHKWSNKNMDIVFENEEIILNGNEELLKQVWINLIDNAIKFSPEYSTVVIKADDKNENNIIVTISDQGEGISSEAQKHIFDKFYQGDISHATQGNGLGLGLGLALVKKIINLHNGQISLKKSSSKGATFEIILPK